VSRAIDTNTATLTGVIAGEITRTPSNAAFILSVQSYQRRKGAIEDRIAVLALGTVAAALSLPVGAFVLVEGHLEAREGRTVFVSSAVRLLNAKGRPSAEKVPA